VSAVANCPSCGAPVEFAIGSSAVVICGYCNSVVARTDRGVETYGKVADLIDTGSPLRRGNRGKYRGNSFTISGRTQMQHQAGGVWDEWYAAFDDGRWGWLAEAQGTFYVTFPGGTKAPAYARLELGLRLEELENLMVSEIGTATLASAEGELPWKPVPGETYNYADLTGVEKKFATIDYSETPPLVFKGYEVTLAELGLEEVTRSQRRVSLTQLNCSQCGGPLDLKAPDRSERIWCPNCGSGHDITQGKLQFFQRRKKKKIEPLIPLGSNGTIDGVSYVVAGFMERAVRFDRDYFWTEYLLYNADHGFRWLVLSDDHWSFVVPVSPGEVFDHEPLGAAKTITWNGQTFKLFQEATARVTYVLGEFYWKVAAGEQVDTVDYIAPPFGMSKEVQRDQAREIAYSHARYMQPGEVEQAFGLQNLVRPMGVGPMQPFTGAKLGKLWAVMLGLLVLAAIVTAFLLPGRVLVDQALPMHGEQPPDAPKNGRVHFIGPFDLTGKHNVMVAARTDVNNGWLWIAADLVEESTNRMESVELPIEYWSGHDSDGTSWSEGRRNRKVFIAAPLKGRYLLRLETQWDEKLPYAPALHVRVAEGVFRVPHFLVAALLLSILPIFTTFRHLNFEMQRWKESAHSPFGQIDSGEEDDDE
jgi:hypothetical protein